ncbi:hypothetical protein [Rhodococcus pyridinivorans]|uniref:hypothetical protein n=1 Tax=Rhodococcus pyridinivorans TaxID=103816 RepID=UPI0022842749|nr:hypothetical protein [Rhodococcus pyridinivorans]WAL46805.1 hypothetical protein OQN32_01445 [Rhodococcus pyridinivorans]
MTVEDHEVAARRAGVRALILKHEQRARHGDVSSQLDWKFFEEHRPKGGQMGAPCLGDHDELTPWPCRSFTQMESPMFYMD